MDVVVPPEGGAASFLEAFRDAVDRGEEATGNRDLAIEILLARIFDR